jgi:hypothetical protein
VTIVRACVVHLICLPVDASRDVVLSGGVSSVDSSSRGVLGGGGGNFHLPSLAALHANLKEMVARGATVPTQCRAASAEATLWSRCAQLSQADKTYLAVAFTECHFDMYTHKYKDQQGAKSCQDMKDGREMAECVKVRSTHSTVQRSTDTFPVSHLALALALALSFRC